MNKFFTNTLVIIFFFNCIFLERTGAQNNIENFPLIKSNVSSISIHDGLNFRKNYWTLAPEVKPDVYKASLINGETH